MGNVGDGLNAGNANWQFGGQVAEHFDDHVSKSVPYYNDAHELVCALSDFFINKNSICYELGASTGELTLKLAEHNSEKKDARFIGIEIEEDMINVANKKRQARDAVEFVQGDILEFPLQKADMIISFYTIQFIRPAYRQDVFNKIYESLHWGGAFILFEKVRAADARFQDIVTAVYNDYKLKQGYSPEEILAKARSLKGALEPFSTQGNIDMMKRAGFVDIMTIMKYVNFEGFLAIK